MLVLYLPKYKTRFFLILRLKKGGEADPIITCKGMQFVCRYFLVK